MNKKTIITFMLALVWVAGQAQELKMNEPSFSDYLPLLNIKGYKAYSFDTSAFKDKWAVPVIKEYVKGEETADFLSGWNIAFGIKDKLVYR